MTLETIPLHVQAHNRPVRATMAATEQADGRARRMANEEHLAILKQGVEAWNEWRQQHPKVRPDLDHARLNHANLTGANLAGANLAGASLKRTRLDVTSLAGTNFDQAILQETIFTNVDLSRCKNLQNCQHFSPSTIDIRTLQRSGPLPLSFLRGVGLPDNLIDYLSSLLNQVIQMYSCFISYSAQDDDFAQRLHADLQNKGVRCWFAPHDLPIGAKTLDAIDQAIRTRDKLLLILSEHSIASEWVEDEVTAAYEEERRRGETVLFPVRLDNAVFDTGKAWARANA